MTGNPSLSGQGERCPTCGYPNEADETRCGKCSRRLGFPVAPAHRAGRICAPVPLSKDASPFLTSQNAFRTTPAIAARISRPAPAFPRELRQELSARVQDFRFRQLHPTLPLRFLETPEAGNKVLPMAAAVSESRQPVLPTSRFRSGRRPRSHSASLPQPELNFPAAHVEGETFSFPTVATLRLRLVGQAVDLALTVAAFVVFCLSARMVLGPISWNRFLFASVLVSYFFILLLYGAVFLWLAGATPAMKWLDLCLVDFDGGIPGRAQRLWRFLGVIVSGGSFLLGFLWAAVDEETLSWHDRISKTLLIKTLR